MCSLIELNTITLGYFWCLLCISERFCPKIYFGKQRYRGGWNDNPSVKQYLDNAASLHVQLSATPKLGNSAAKRIRSDIVVDITPLLKSPRTISSHVSRLKAVSCHTMFKGKYRQN